MKHNNSAAEWFNSTNDRDGADITPAEYSLESWWSSLTGFDFSATGVWAWHNANKLPILRGLGTQNPKVSAFAAVETTFVVSGTAFPMVWINAGIFLMGSPENEPYRNSFETLHEVTLTSGFYMGKYEVTQAQYEMVMGVTIAAQQALATNPSTWNYGQGDYYPMYYVSWYDAIVFCNKLSILEGLSPVYRINGSTDPAAWGDVPTSSDATWNNVEIVPGSNGYRLPTGAQWEYSCRAGTTEAFNWGTNYVNSTQAKYDDPLERSSVVGFYAPNAWGLYDMHGNVSEWCWDWWYDYSDSGDRAVTDPSGPSSGDRRIFRGGGFRSGGVYLRSASWSGGSPEVRHEDRGGFRVIRPYK
jgi:formylglycine-generating enzyme required for sulfatase activity